MFLSQEPSAINTCYLLLYCHILVYTSPFTVQSSNQFALFNIPVFYITFSQYKAPLFKAPLERYYYKNKKIINKHKHYSFKYMNEYIVFVDGFMTLMHKFIAVRPEFKTVHLLFLFLSGTRSDYQMLQIIRCRNCCKPYVSK